MRLFFCIFVSRFLCVFWLSAKQDEQRLKSSRPYTSIHILKITLGLEAGHGILLGVSGTEIKWHHRLGIKKNVDEVTAIGGGGGGAHSSEESYLFVAPFADLPHLHALWDDEIYIKHGRTSPADLFHSVKRNLLGVRTTD